MLPLVERGRPSWLSYKTLKLAYDEKMNNDEAEINMEELRKSLRRDIEERSFTVRIDSEETLIKMIKFAMENREINNKALSEAIKKPAGNTSRLINSGNMQIKTLLQLCEALGLKLYLKGRFNKKIEL
jgi:DNA-binding Xre family transcriptional regulator